MGAKTKTREERLFGAACLKVTLEAKVKAPAENIEIYTSTLEELGLEEHEVQQYLETHEAHVRAALEGHGRTRH